MAADVTMDPIVHCTVCPSALLVDARDVTARLHHYGDGSHRLIPAPDPPAAIAPEPGDEDLEIGLLAVAVRLRLLTEDLDRILHRLGYG